MKAYCHGPTARRLVLSVIEPHSTALRADVEHYIVDVVGLEFDGALRTRTAVIRPCLAAILRGAVRECCGFFALNGFFGKPKTVTVATHRVSHGAFRIRLQEMTVVRASEGGRE